MKHQTQALTGAAKLKQLAQLIRLANNPRRVATRPPRNRSRNRRVKWRVIFDWYRRGQRCDLNDICDYLDQLGPWLQEHYERNYLDHEAIKNLERIAYFGWTHPLVSPDPILVDAGNTDPPGEDPPPVW